MVSSLPSASLFFSSRSHASTGNCCPARILCQDGLELILGGGEDHADGVELRDHHQTIRIAGMHDVSRIHQPQTHQAGDRRRDVAVNQIQLGAVDLRLVGLDGAFILSHQRLLGVELLLRNRVLLHQRLVSIQIEVRVLEQRLIVDQLSFGLLQLHFIRPRIDLHQQVALMNDLPLFELHFHELPVHPALHRDGVDGRYRAQAGYEHLDAASRRTRCHYLRHAAAPAAPSPALRSPLPGRLTSWAKRSSAWAIASSRSPPISAIQAPKPSPRGRAALADCSGYRPVHAAFALKGLAPDAGPSRAP